EIPEPIICRKYSGINLNPNDPLYWMNAAEVSFLRAEAKAVYGFNMQGEAKDFYENGIRLSFAQWGVDGADDYM
ncbi:SusD/RagB family nutrient-binding outer membrane lipoprotein, partial [Acinetobacter baumannii]|nr:SusD/RagB family nutrient-binding outer membrane lipoprotein [Acinetobacter baumannii]